MAPRPTTRVPPWDPYHRLDDGLRERLLAYYVNAMQAASRDFDQDSFKQSILPCCLQRHMQALGAYGFPQRVKGKKYFVKHVPEALRLLKDETELARNDYPTSTTSSTASPERASALRTKKGGLSAARHIHLVVSACYSSSALPAVMVPAL